MKTTILIQNLKCGGCANTITSKISNIENISNVMVDVDASSVTFENTSDEDVHNVREKLAAIGYPEEGQDNTIVSKAKSFVSCATGRMNK